MTDPAATNKMPVGPWLLVVGMHRSGTSAIAGALGALGFAVPSPADRIPPHSSNPEHWESESISSTNEAILDRFHGSWDAPPDLPLGWELNDPRVDDIEDSSAQFAATFPARGVLVWKDPRLCLLLPYYRSIIPVSYCDRLHLEISGSGGEVPRSPKSNGNSRRPCALGAI